MVKKGDFYLRSRFTIEYAFYMASGLLLVLNFGKLIGIEKQCIYIDLGIVKEQVFILLLLCLFISKKDETPYRSKVLGWLKFMLFLFTAGMIAKKTYSVKIQSQND